MTHERVEYGGRIEGSSERFAEGYASRGGYGDVRVIEHERDSVRRGPRCLTACPGQRDDPRRFDFTGIDERGYLVWPGKVEY
jgi:hypothetical protein